jgi:cytoskeletal protein CcmA (bactofilin family)
MSDPISSSPFGNDPFNTNESDYVAQLGRISGKLLSENLLRNGVDLTFRNGSSDPDILYLDVTGRSIGINTDAPGSNALKVDTAISSKDFVVTDSSDIDLVTISANTFSTNIVSTIEIIPNQTAPLVNMPAAKAGNILFDDNVISNTIAGENIRLDPSGAGEIIIDSSATINGDLYVTGNIGIDGNLSKQGDIIIGDSPLDIVTIVPDFQQSIIPGADATYDFGKINFRWSNIYAYENSGITNIAYDSITVGDQMQIDGNTASISTLQSNDDLFLSPETARTFIESIKIENNDITGTVTDVAFTQGSTGIGYVRFVSDSAVVIPAGDSSERTVTPEAGDTRWNTELGFLEVFDGTNYIICTGPAGFISPSEFNDLSIEFSLTLG